MTISSASDALEQLDYVTEAGAAPTDKGKIPCFQVKLDGANAMNDSNEEEVRSIIRDKMQGEFNGSLTVQSSKEVIEEGTERETCCFWVYAFGSLGSFNKGGVEYNVSYWNPDWGVEAVPVGRADPMRAEAERFKWSEVPISAEDLE